MTNKEAKTFLDNLKVCVEEHPIVADWLVEITDRKTEPSDSEIPNNSTISKMEQVDKPQADCGNFADRLAYERGVKHAWEVAQKVFDSTVTFYEAEDLAKQIDKTEPQTLKELEQARDALKRMVVEKMAALADRLEQTERSKE